MTAATFDTIVARIADVRAGVSPSRSVLVAVSGIDGCGKGHVTARLAATLEARGLGTAPVNIDGWLSLPERRFDAADPAGHFYRNAIRFDEMFDRFILPLRDGRSIRVEADFTEEEATSYRKHVYDYLDIDVILLEGIYLLKQEFRAHYDLSIWIDCTFETALERAIARAQEGLPPAETIRAYRTIYFPAQEIHFTEEDPRSAATFILSNDLRLAGGVGG